MGETARRAFVATLVALSVIVLALLLWKLRLVIGLVFTGFIVAAAIRPSIEFLRRRGIPRVVGLALHYALFAGLIAVLLYFVIPRALHQVTAAVDNLPQTRQNLKHAANQSSGIKRDVLLALQRRLKEVPHAGDVVAPAVEVGKTAMEVIIGIFFVFAVAGYWIFERDRLRSVVRALVPRKHRRIVVDTWELIDLRLGAFVRGQGLIIVIAASLLSFLFWLIGLPYWLLIGCFAGFVELVPVIGPLAAGALAVGVGFTQSVHLAVLAAAVVGGVRLAQDYLINPRVMGGAVGISPLVILINASAVVFLFGGFAVLLAVPIAAVLVTLIDVIVRDKDPAEEETPTVLFPAKEAER